MKRSELQKIENWQMLKYGKVKKVLTNSDTDRIGYWIPEYRYVYTDPRKIHVWYPHPLLWEYFENLKWNKNSYHFNNPFPTDCWYQLTMTRRFARWLIEYRPEVAKHVGLIG